MDGFAAGGQKQSCRLGNLSNRGSSWAIGMKSAAEYREDLIALKESYCRAGINLDDIEDAFLAWKNALRFLERHKDENHPREAEYRAVVESSKDLAKKHKKILKIEEKIRTRTRLEDQRSVEDDNVRGEDDEGGGDNDGESMDVEVDDGDSIQDKATTATFLILYEAFVKVIVENNGMRLNEYAELSRRDVIEEFYQAFKENDVLDLLLPALKKLEEIGVLSISSDYLVRAQCHFLRLFHYIKNALRNISRETTWDDIYGFVCKEKEKEMCHFVNACVEIGGLVETRLDDGDKKYVRGPRYDNVRRGRLTYWEHWLVETIEFLFNYNMQHNGTAEALLSDIILDLAETDDECFTDLLPILSSLDLCIIVGDVERNFGGDVVTETIVDSGPALSWGYKHWLKDQSNIQSQSAGDEQDEPEGEYCKSVCSTCFCLRL